MKVVLVNGSPNANGCTYTGLSIIKERLAEHGVHSEIFQVGKNRLSAAPFAEYVAARTYR